MLTSVSQYMKMVTTHSNTNQAYYEVHSDAYLICELGSIYTQFTIPYGFSHDITNNRF